MNPEETEDQLRGGKPSFLHVIISFDFRMASSSRMGSRCIALYTIMSGIAALHPLDPLSDTEIQNAVKCCR